MSGPPIDVVCIVQHATHLRIPAQEEHEVEAKFPISNRLHSNPSWSCNYRAIYLVYNCINVKEDMQF